jgi:mercuric ion transport protein
MILPIPAEGRVAALGMLASIAALFSAAACCVLPLAFASVGIGAGGLALFVPWRWPLTIAALVAVAAGWFFYLRRRRISGATAAPARTTFFTLCVATTFAGISALWGYIEQPLMIALEG